MSEINPKQIAKEETVEEVPDSLRLMQGGSYEVNQFLNNLGIDHNPDSIVLEDSFNTVFYGDNNGDFEVWVCHKSVPYLNARAYKVNLDECNTHYVSELTA
jgi:hypothetical protein